MHLGGPAVAELLNPSQEGARERSQARVLSEGPRSSAWEICLQMATCRQGMMHKPCFLPRYLGKPVLIVVSQQHRIDYALGCAGEQDFHRYPCLQLPGCGKR